MKKRESNQIKKGKIRLKKKVGKSRKGGFISQFCFAVCYGFL